MRITSLQLDNFRNYQTLEIQPGPGLNIFVGRNAQGKSNLLEALYILATSKSTRASKDTELIRFDQPAARVTADLLRDKNSDIEIQLILSQTEKKISSNQWHASHKAGRSHRTMQCCSL